MSYDSQYNLNNESAINISADIRSVKIDKAEIIRSLGYSEDKIDEHFVQLIEQVLSRLQDLCYPEAGYKFVSFKANNENKNGVYLADIYFNTGEIVLSQLRKSDKAAIFVCSIGSGLENWSKDELKNGDPALSYIINTVASVAAENLADYLHHYIADTLKTKGMNVTNRYSPGYCNWSVAEQQKLFSLLPKEFCGVALTESSLMIPVKSVSGIIGIGTEVKWEDYICDRCGRTDCIYRVSNSRLSK